MATVSARLQGRNQRIPKGRQDSDRFNNNDRDSLTDPNAMGPTMRAPYDATASGPSQGADMHNNYPEVPGRSNGIIGVSRRNRGKA